MTRLVYIFFSKFLCKVSFLIITKFQCQMSFLIIPPVYEVYRGYIVFAFSVCLCVCSLFFVKDFSGTTVPRILKLGTIFGYDKLYCVRKNQPHMAYQHLYLSIFLSFQ